MRKFLLLLLILLCGFSSFVNHSIPLVANSYYVDAVNGNDNNSGFFGAPWQHISKVNGFNLLHGDKVFFNKGNTWTETLTVPTSGQAGDSITFDTYGSGAMPIIDGGNTRTNTINFNNKAFIVVRGIHCINALGANEFQGSISLGLTLIQGVRVVSCLIENNRRSGILIGGNSTNCISYQLDSNTIIKNGDFGVLGQSLKPFPVNSNTRIWNNFADSNGLKSLADAREVGNLQGNFGGVDIAFNEISHAAPGTAKDDLTSHGIYVAGPTKFHANIHDNNIHDNPNGDGVKARYAMDCYRNNIYNNHHGGVELGQDVDTNAAYLVHNNALWNNSKGQATQGFPGINCNNGPVGTAHVTRMDIYNNTVYHNTFTNSGNEVSISFAADTMNFKNNIVIPMGARPALNVVNQTGIVSIDYNSYYWLPTNSPFSSTYGGSTRTFTGWQAIIPATGTTLNHPDIHGIIVNPLLVDVSTNNFHLTSGSPCRGAGIDVGYGTDIGAFPFASAINTPVINWVPASPKTYPFSLDASVLNATATFGGNPVAGTFTYSPNFGTIPNAGTVSLSVTFNPTDPTSFSTVSATRTITVNKGTATISFGNLNQTYTGFALQPTITTNPSGLTLSTTYNGVGAAPINAGTYNVSSSVNDINYQSGIQTATFTIAAAAATINITNTAQIYDGTSKSATVTTSPAGLPVTVTYNGSGTLPINAGSYTVVATLNDPNHTATPVTTTLVIAKATPIVSWTPLTPITYPTTLSGSQLNASASVAGTFIYTPASGTILNAGPQTLSADFTPTDAANYNSVNGTTRTITVNKGTATISISNLSQTYDGTQKTVTVTTSPVGLGTLTITYNGSTTPPTAVGSYPINIILNNSNYNATPATATLVISKGDATVSLNNLTQVYNGSQRVVTATTVPAGLLVNITYNGSGIAPTNAGSYPIIATINDPNLQGSTTVTLVVNKATPIITWNSPVSIVYNTPLSGTQLNASANVPGTFVYTPPSGTILNVGTSNLVVDFTPTDALNYNSVNGTTVSITVTKATAVISVSNLNQSFDGNPKPVTVSVSPNVGVIAVLYNGSPTAPSAVGSYPVSVTLTNNNYTAVPFSGTLLISSSSASVTITNTSQTYDGSPKPVTVTTIPAGLPVIITYDDATTVPTNAGSYDVEVSINDGGIHTGSASATLTINKANPIVSWSNPTFISYGTPLSGTQLNASANVSGAFAYTPASGTILNAGTNTLSVNFTPTDIANYNVVNGVTVNITVIKATATISLSNLNQVFDGSQKVVTVTTSPIGLAAISVTYNGSNTPPSAVGSYTVVASLNNSNYVATPANGTLVITTTTAGIFISNLAQNYTGLPLPVTVTTNPVGLSNTVTYNGSPTVPTASGTYTVIATLNDGIHTGADTETYVISKSQSIITWPNPASIIFGTPLSSTQLNASANNAGTFAYSPISGTILNAVAQSLSVTFTPNDNNFLPATKTVTIVVNQATATLTLSNLTQTYNGTQRPVIVTTSPLGLSGVTVLYNGSLTPPTNAGTYPITVTLVNANYTATPISGTLTINKATPTLAWAQPASIPALTPLSTLQLNATSSVSGTFIYNPPIGTLIPVGTSILLATFTPTDAVNYNSGTVTTSINIYDSPVKSIFIKHGNEKYMDAPTQ